jgi:ferritin-like protein
MRRRAMRRATLLAAVALLATALAACGGGGDSTSSSGATSAAEEKEADVEAMNEILGRQQAAVKAYEEVLPALRGSDRVLAEKLYAQEQEHADAVVKALRGLGGEADPATETIEAGELKTAAENLEFLYELENGTIAAEVTAISKLTQPWPRTLLAITAADQAEHLTLLRRALGAKPLETIPFPFENGTNPSPSEMMEEE